MAGRWRISRNQGRTLESASIVFGPAVVAAAGLVATVVVAATVAGPFAG